MRRGVVIGVILLVIGVAIATGIGAYNAGINEGLERSSEATEVVRVVGPGFGFFPFGFFVFPLIVFGIFALARSARWRRSGGHEHWGPGPWRGREAMAEEWHRRQHGEEAAGAAVSGGDPVGPGGERPS